MSDSVNSGGDGCSEANCGCQITSLSTSEECPRCGRALRLVGQSQRLEFRLTCQSCGYQSHLLSQEELQVLL